MLPQSANHLLVANLKCMLGSLQLLGGGGGGGCVFMSFMTMWVFSGAFREILKSRLDSLINTCTTFHSYPPIYSFYFLVLKFKLGLNALALK